MLVCVACVCVCVCVCGCVGERSSGGGSSQSRSVYMHARHKLCMSGLGKRRRVYLTGHALSYVLARTRADAHKRSDKDGVRPCESRCLHGGTQRYDHVACAHVRKAVHASMHASCDGSIVFA